MLSDMLAALTWATGLEVNNAITSLTIHVNEAHTTRSFDLSASIRTMIERLMSSLPTQLPIPVNLDSPCARDWVLLKECILLNRHLAKVRNRLRSLDVAAERFKLDDLVTHTLFTLQNGLVPPDWDSTAAAGNVALSDWLKTLKHAHGELLGWLETRVIPTSFWVGEFSQVEALLVAAKFDAANLAGHDPKTVEMRFIPAGKDAAPGSLRISGLSLHQASWDADSRHLLPPVQPKLLPLKEFERVNTLAPDVEVFFAAPSGEASAEVENGVDVDVFADTQQTRLLFTFQVPRGSADLVDYAISMIPERTTGITIS